MRHPAFWLYLWFKSKPIDLNHSLFFYVFNIFVAPQKGRTQEAYKRTVEVSKLPKANTSLKLCRCYQTFSREK